MLSVVTTARRPAWRAARHARLYYSEVVPHSSPSESNAWLFLSSIFPARFASWDFRFFLAQWSQNEILAQIHDRLSEVHSHGFKPVSVEPYLKDGGVFVKFAYTPGGAEQDVLPEIESAVRRHFAEKDGIPSFTYYPQATAWVTRGRPWREDLHRFPTPILRVAFDGPDITEEALYGAFRPFGLIRDISAPALIPNTPYRGSSIFFNKPFSAIAARNVNQGRIVNNTRLRIFYNPPVNAHVIRDWMTNHPRISIPLLIFIFGTITYTVFDPIRTFTIEAKMGDWLDYRQFTVYKWLRRNTLDRFSFLSSSQVEADAHWQQHRDAMDALGSYLTDTPSSIAFLHGPQGSGKSRMIDKLLSDEKRPTLVIECAELAHARSDAHLLAVLARQLGYWPSFPFLNNLYNVIDMATKGLIGQPAGLGASAPEQVKQMLDIALAALQKIGARRSRLSAKEKVVEKVQPDDSGSEKEPQPAPESLDESSSTQERGWLTVVRDHVPNVPNPLSVLSSFTGDAEKKDAAPSPQAPSRRPPNKEATAEVAALPIVVIRNFAAAGARTDVMNVFARWVAIVAENKLAHVVVVADNRENSKAIAKALPSKPLNMVALYDADAATALQFVKQRLREAGLDADFSAEQTADIQRLGGRASDLSSLIHKVRAGLRVEEAVEDIVNRSVSELRKNAFGDDAEDAKSLPWTREQAWAVLKALARASEAPYHDVLANHPFKGDEGALRQMERAELVTIGMRDGLPSVIRPGKPVYRYVFEKLVNDPVFHAMQEISYNTKLIDSANATIHSSEDELSRLASIGTDSTRSWYGTRGATRQRAHYLLENMRTAQEALEKLERENVELKQILKKSV